MAEIKLATGEVVIVDDATAKDFGRFAWRLSRDGEVVADMQEFEVMLSRIVCGLARGDKKIVVHTNGDKLDCRRCNLSASDAPARGARKVIKNNLHNSRK